MPAFMTAKPESEWSEDEKKAAQDYERRVKELEEERDKYRKVRVLTEEPFMICLTSLVYIVAANNVL